MQDVFDIYTIIFLALAVFIFLRLRSVLGQRTGRERPPYDPFSARDAVRGSTGDKVVTLPTRGVEAPAKAGRAGGAGGRPLEGHRAGGLGGRGRSRRDLAADKTFRSAPFPHRRARRLRDDRHRLRARRPAHLARARCRRRSTTASKAVIRERESRGETAETRFVSIDTTDIAGAELRGRTAQVTVRFVSQLVSVTRDKTGNVIDGNPDKVTDVTDVWTFARDVSSRDPNWKLVATEAGH